MSVKSIGKVGSLPESLATTPAVVATNLLPTAGGTLPLSLSQLALREAMQGIQSALSSRFPGSAFSHQQRFHDHHGRNVVLKNNGQTAQRTASYNQVVILVLKLQNVNQHLMRWMVNIYSRRAWYILKIH